MDNKDSNADYFAPLTIFFILAFIAIWHYISL